MAEIPDTRESLLIRVKDARDQEAWSQFVAIYRPIIYRLARSRGMQDADAQDLSQRVLVSVSAAVGRWKPNTGNSRFRDWLMRIARNAIINALTRQPKDRAGGGDAHWDSERPSNEHDPLNQQLQLEYRRQLYRRAAQVVRERADETTWLAFAMTMVDGLSVAEVATQLGITAGNVYAARSRIVRRLKNVIADLEGEG